MKNKTIDKRGKKEYERIGPVHAARQAHNAHMNVITVITNKPKKQPKFY